MKKKTCLCFNILFVMLVLAVFSGCPFTPPGTERIPGLDGRSEGTWYQIFTGSFFDSNGDGIGDLRGINMKLDYLNDSHSQRHRDAIENHGVCNHSLHIDGIWLTPIMPSPSYHKYDTINYKDIDPQFGTMEDFRDLLIECHRRGIKLIIDLVMNHSSEQHYWFQNALAEVRAGRPGRYASYYNIYYGPIPPQNETFEYQYNYWGDRYVSARYFKQWGNIAPNAWFEGSFWTGMPDLNFDSALLREEFEDIVEFWLTAGLDGFRLDATSWPYDYYRLGQMQNEYDGVNVSEKNIELWTWFNRVCRQVHPDVYLVGECWEDESIIADYYRSGMNFFAFQFVSLGTFNWVLNNGFGHRWANDVIVNWERRIKSRNPQAISAMFLSNHDKARTFYQFGGNDVDGDARRKMAAALYLMSPGTPFIYYGEEIGLVDFAANNHAGGVYHDADYRGPMWWSNSNQHGIPAPPDERRTWPVKAPPSGMGVEEQLDDPGSLLRFYIKIVNLKNQYRWLAYADDIEALYLGDGRISAWRVRNPDNHSQTILLVQNTDQHNTVAINVPRPVTRFHAASVFGNQEGGFTADELRDGREWNAGAGTSFDVFGYSTVIFQEY